MSTDRVSSRISYDNTGNTYNVTHIINSDASLNLTAYKQYSPLFLSCVVLYLLLILMLIALSGLPLQWLMDSRLLPSLR